MIINLARAKHRFSGCPCSHAEHTADGFNAPELVRCPECEVTERRENVVIAVELAQRVDRLSLVKGSAVKCAGVAHRVVSIEGITKLGGAIVTGYARVKMRAMA